MISPKPFAFAVGLFFLVAVCQPLAAADRYVRGSTGVNAPGCTNSANPCQTITYTLGQSVCGDIIHIHGDGGTPYNETVTVSSSCTSGNELTFQAWSGNGTPVIASSGGAGMQISGAYIIIDGLSLDGNAGDGIDTLGVNNFIVKNSTIANNGGAGIQSFSGGGNDWTIQNNSFVGNTNRGVVFTGNNVTIDGNTISGTVGNQSIYILSTAGGTFTITNNTISGSLGAFDEAVAIYRTTAVTSCTISGNQIFDNPSTGMISRTPSCTIKNNLFFNNGLYGMEIQGNNVVLESNTIYNTSSHGIRLVGAYTGTIATNNILAANGGFGINDSADTNEPTESYNLFFNNTSGACGNMPGKCSNGVNGDIVGSDPLFVNGFRLSQTASGQGSDSPALDAGSDTAVNLGLDTKTTRTDNVSDSGLVDMGFHYQGGAPSTTRWAHPPPI